MDMNPWGAMVDWLLEPLAFEFMQRGLLIAVVVGIICALVGCYIVLRGMAFLGDALAHAILPGLAVGYLVSAGDRGTLFWWALGTAVVTSVGIGALSRGVRIKQDTAIGIVFAGMFALGIALISTVRNYAVDLTHFLFGNVLGVTRADLWLTAGVGVAVLVIIFFFYKEFLVLSFDPTLVTTLRLPARTLEVLLSILMAVAIVVSLQTVGVALVVALLVTPAAAASLVTKNLRSMMFLASVIAAGSGVIGLYASYYLNVASGAAIVLTCTFFFILIWFGKSVMRKVKGLPVNN
ncbi:MAG TPA: metal ABC transporter permease [Anaerolineales bacterium]|jgi:manganese/iron transport system permease protein|nr:metal ABC transporter permease [Anaerolineales bacterium]